MVIFHPQYVKKDEIRNFLIRQWRYASVVFFALAIVVGIMRFFVYPQLADLHEKLNIPLPVATAQSPTIMVVLTVFLLITALYFFKKQPNDEHIRRLVDSTKGGDLVNTGYIINPIYQLLVLVTLGIVISYFITSIILPIYNLTNSF